MENLNLIEKLFRKCSELILADDAIKEGFEVLCLKILKNTMGFFKRKIGCLFHSLFSFSVIYY